MITTSPRPLASLLLSAAFTAAIALPAQAGVIYQTSFTGSAGPFETAEGYSDWHIHHSSTSVPPTLQLNGDGLLEITNPQNGTTSSQFGGAIYTGNTSIANGQVSGVIQYVANGNQSSGLFARIQNPTGNGNSPEGYFAGILRYNPGSGNQTYLVIAKDIEFTETKSYLLASVQIGVSSGSFYRLEFDFDGTSLSATLFNASNSQIATVSATDASYTTGAVGLRANITSTDRTIGFDSFQVTAIPEPSTALLLLPAGVAGAAFLRKHRSR